MALAFQLEAGRLWTGLNAQLPFAEAAYTLLSGSDPQAVLSTVVLLLQGGLLPSDCQQMQALYLLSAAARAAPACGALLVQAAGSEATGAVVRSLALALLARGPGAVAQLTPQEFMQTLFDPATVLAAPTLQELQREQNGEGGAWLPDAAAVRAAVLPPDEAAALRELGAWAADSTDGAGHAAPTAQLAAQLMNVLYGWAAAASLRQQQIVAALQPAVAPAGAVMAASTAPGGTLPDSSSSSSSSKKRAAAGVCGMHHAGKPSAASAEQLRQGAPAASSGAPPSSEAASCSSAVASEQDHARLAQLLDQAQRFPLLPGDQRELVAGLQASARAAAACQPDLGAFRGLVENNPLVAAWLLIAINWHAQRGQQQPSAEEEAAARSLREELEDLSKSIPNYLAVLCTLPMSNHSMECMTTLVNCAPPPPTVLAVFVANCIRSIEATQEANWQARLAKLLCAFLQHLLDCGQEGVVPAVYADVQAFCIAWSRLREAAALFRRLKALEGGLPEEEGEEEAALESPGSSGLHKGG